MEKDKNLLPTERMFLVWFWAKISSWYKKIKYQKGQLHRWVIKGWGIYVWKQYSMFIPEIDISFGNLMKYSISINTTFHNGAGLRIHLGKFIILNWAYIGIIGWWLKHKFQIGLFYREKIGTWLYEKGFEHKDGLTEDEANKFEKKIARVKRATLVYPCDDSMIRTQFGWRSYMEKWLK